MYDVSAGRLIAKYALSELSGADYDIIKRENYNSAI